mgnify:CR=1 FL=1
MPADMSNDIMGRTSFGIIALEKMEKHARTPEAMLTVTNSNFRIFEAGSLATGALKVTGALFRKAECGTNSGKLCVEVPGTRFHAIVTAEEMEAYDNEHR